MGQLSVKADRGNSVSLIVLMFRSAMISYLFTYNNLFQQVNQFLIRLSHQIIPPSTGSSSLRRGGRSSTRSSAPEDTSAKESSDGEEREEEEQGREAGERRVR